MAKKILVITPRFPLPDTGACEQDRLEGLKQLKRLGFEVRVLAKVFQFQDREAIRRFSQESGIPIELVGYEREKKRAFGEALGFYARRFFFPFYWDGAAYEYSHSETRQAVEREIRAHRPDAVWFDYTYLWPLYSIAKKAGIPIITRSINFEPLHFLQEDGRSFVNIAKSLSKFLSEWLTILKSDWMFAITPQEEKIYRRMGARRISTLPLRSLPRFLRSEHKSPDRPLLNVFFAGSTYTVSHNRKAVEFIIRDIVPAIEKKAPDVFAFHITGGKLPSDIAAKMPKSVEYHGFVEDWETFLSSMDIALVPSFLGAGMQQKIFEPLSRGIPTIASARGLAGYPFKRGIHVVAADTSCDFIGGLLALRNAKTRQEVSRGASRLSEKLFSKHMLDSIILHALVSHHVRN